MTLSGDKVPGTGETYTLIRPGLHCHEQRRGHGLAHCLSAPRKASPSRQPKASPPQALKASGCRLWAI